MRAIALEQVRTEAKGEAATKKFAELLPTLPPGTQVSLLAALAARGDKAAAPEVRKLLAASKDDAPRLAALDALGYLGNETDVPTLVAALSEKPETLQQKARASLIRVAGNDASQAIIQHMIKASAPERVQLIEILTERRAGAKELLAITLTDSQQARASAMQALGNIARPEHVEEMLRGVLKASPGKERAAAERAVAAVCQRIEDADQQAQPILAAMEKFSAKERNELMPGLGRVGGPAALKVVDKALADKDDATKAAGLLALCNWPNGAVVARLLEIARAGEDAGDRTQARKALIRIAPLEDERTDVRRLDLLRTLLAMCDNDAERNQVLERAKAVRTVETLRFIVPYMDEKPFSAQACLTVVELAHHIKLREAHEDEFHRALDKAIATSKDAVVIDRAKRYKTDQTWVRPKEMP